MKGVVQKIIILMNWKKVNNIVMSESSLIPWQPLVNNRFEKLKSKDKRGSNLDIITSPVIARWELKNQKCSLVLDCYTLNNNKAVLEVSGDIQGPMVSVPEVRSQVEIIVRIFIIQSN